MEDGLPLGPSGSPFEGIAEQGRGRFRHYKKRLLFSTSDNSDPNANGRAYGLKAAPCPGSAPDVLEMKQDGRGGLIVPQAAVEEMRRLKPELVLLVEPPDKNTTRIIRAARRCGPGLMVLRLDKRWEVVDLNRSALFRPRLLASLGRRSLRRQAAGVRHRLSPVYSRVSGLLPEGLLHLLFRLQSGPRIPQVPAWIKRGGGVSANAPAKADPRRALFNQDLELEHGRPFQRPETDPENLRIVQYISQLGPGGAERQSCYLAGGLKRSGHGVTLLTSFPLQGSSAHYASLLRSSGVRCSQAGEGDAGGLIKTALEDPYLKKGLLPFIPPALAPLVRNLAADLLRIKPQVIHCWLDWSNIIGGLAGYLAGTPLIVLSTRNLNPSRFPTFYRPWQQAWYSFLVRSRRVQLVANSKAGAEDYASWLGLRPESFRVIRNGLDPTAVIRPSSREIISFRKELGLKKDELLVGGVFRLDPEKRPLDFIKIIKMIRDGESRIKAVIAGQGTLSQWLRKEVRRLGLEDVVFLLGRRTDAARIMSACRVILLTSRYEGTPNVLIEAQWLGIPVVAAGAGGVSETMADGVSGFLHEVGDVDSLTRSVSRLLGDAELRERFGRAGRRFVEQTFDLQGSISTTLDLYRNHFKTMEP